MAQLNKRAPNEYTSHHLCKVDPIHKVAKQGDVTERKFKGVSLPEEMGAVFEDMPCLY